VYPASLQYLSRGGANVLAIMWFVMLFLFGIDTVFAHVEATVTAFTDTPRFRHMRKETITAFVCAAGFLMSLAFASNIGHGLIDAFDHYVIHYAMFFTGAMEAYTVAWIWGWQEISRKCGFMCACDLPTHRKHIALKDKKLVRKKA
jgi:SNF family Na+-dependent transporter